MTVFKPSTPTFELAPGFTSAAVACGLKASGALDLAIVAADAPCTSAGLFTTNRVQAAPVVYDREILARGAHEVRCIVANSGCANACTGGRGLDDVRRMAAWTAGAIGCRADQVLVLSTGVIGVPLDMEKVERGIRGLAGSRRETDAGPASRAILTTDTVPKTASADVDANGGRVAIRGFAKGAGMIHPRLATMLCILTTDAAASPAWLEGALRAAARTSFDRLSVDGDMSTNDTVLLLASGASGVEVEDDSRTASLVSSALTEACVSLARQIARDGEGATRLVEVTVSGATTEDEAHVVADAIARSALVRTAIHGADPNWGRVLAAAGSTDVAIDPARLGLVLGSGSEAIVVVAGGLPTEFDPARASAAFRKDPVCVSLDLGRGHSQATVWTCDLSAEYVAINAHYTT